MEKKNEPNVYSSSDYAGLVSGTFSAYYGYEEENEDGEWCFVAKDNGKEILRIPSSDLHLDDNFNCEFALLKGLAVLFEVKKLIDAK